MFRTREGATKLQVPKTDLFENTMAANTQTIPDDMFPPLGEESLGVVHGKVGMWTFLVMDAMTFAGFLAGYARLRWGVGAGDAQPWPYPYETFGTVGIQLTAFNTFILVCSSVTMVHALAEALKGNSEVAQK